MVTIRKPVLMIAVVVVALVVFGAFLFARSMPQAHAYGNDRVDTIGYINNQTVFKVTNGSSVICYGVGDLGHAAAISCVVVPQ